MSDTTMRVENARVADGVSASVAIRAKLGKTTGAEHVIEPVLGLARARGHPRGQPSRPCLLFETGIRRPLHHPRRAVVGRHAS